MVIVVCCYDDDDDDDGDDNDDDDDDGSCRDVDRMAVQLRPIVLITYIIDPPPLGGPVHFGVKINIP